MLRFAKKNTQRFRIIMHSSRGNVLFLILIAVVLFAVLAYAVTKSSRNGNANTSGDKANLAASQIVQYITGLKAARDRLLLTGKFDQVRFSVLNGSEASLVYSGSASTAGRAGGVFDPAPNGAGYPKMKVPAAWLNPAYSDVLTYVITDVKIGSVRLGTTAGDEIIVMKYLTKDICDELNQKLRGNKNMSTIVFDGSTNGSASQNIANGTLIVSGINTSGGGGITLPAIPVCVYDTSTTAYTFYYDIAAH